MGELMCEFRRGHKQVAEEAEAASIVANATGLHVCRNDVGLGSAPADYRLLDASFFPVGLLEVTSIRDARRTETLQALFRKHPNLTIPVPFSSAGWSIGTDENFRVKEAEKTVVEAILELDTGEPVNAFVVYPHPVNKPYELPEHINNAFHRLGITRLTRHPRTTMPGVVHIGIGITFWVPTWETVSIVVANESRKNRDKFATTATTDLRELFIWLEDVEFGCGGYLNEPPVGSVDLPPEVGGIYIASRGTTERPPRIWHSDGSQWNELASPTVPM